MNDFFRKFAHKTAGVVGSPWAFIAAVLVILVWLVTGPMFGFSDTWQLIINTGTTIITFLMVFLIQNTQNRDAQVLHLKLDELIRAVGKARTELVDMEEMSDEELAALQGQFRRLHVREQRQGRKAAAKVTKAGEELVAAARDVADDERQADQGEQPGEQQGEQRRRRRRRRRPPRERGERGERGDRNRSGGGGEHPSAD